MLKFDPQPALKSKFLRHDRDRYPGFIREDLRLLIEWIIRNNRKIEDYTRVEVVPQGNGGLYLANPTAVVPALNLTTSWQKVTGFDTECTPQPLGIETDMANNRFRLTEPGLWFYNFDLVAEITPFTANKQDVGLAIYNEKSGTPTIIGYEAIPRNSDVFQVAKNAMRTESAIVGDWLSLWIKQGTASPTVTINTLVSLEMSGFILKRNE